MASACYVLSVVLLYIIGGTGVSIVLKLLYETSVPGKDGEPKKFQKPWFTLGLMFICMSLSLFKWWADQRRSARTVSQGSMGKVALKLAFPGMLQLVGTGVQAIGLLWVPVSIYQMLQASTIIFSAVVRYVWMGKGLLRFELYGIILVAIGLTEVGAASLLQSSSDSAQASATGAVITGISLVLFSQAIMALEGVLEERAMHGSAAPPEFVCGVVGLWGLLYTSCFVLPVAQFLPGTEGNGLREDTLETFLMLKDSQTLRMTLVLFFVVVFTYNYCQRLVIHVTQATTMQVLGGLRTLSVWVVALLMYFAWPSLGEKWEWQTWIELFGFVTLMLGVFMYRATVKFPCFVYPEPEKDIDNRDSSMGDSTSLVPSEGA